MQIGYKSTKNKPYFPDFSRKIRSISLFYKKLCQFIVFSITHPRTMGRLESTWLAFGRIPSKAALIHISC